MRKLIYILRYYRIQLRSSWEPELFVPELGATVTFHQSWNSIQASVTFHLHLLWRMWRVHLMVSDGAYYVSGIWQPHRKAVAS